mmetsp:Transcript_44442/g.125472  ORF Transcript_44442/g.125472 Transcript_44442/m.125472 type:complete len:216 (-) Transcript_44442:323-970(-)
MDLALEEPRRGVPNEDGSGARGDDLGAAGRDAQRADAAARLPQPMQRGALAVRMPHHGEVLGAVGDAREQPLPLREDPHRAVLARPGGLVAEPLQHLGFEAPDNRGGRACDDGVEVRAQGHEAVAAGEDLHFKERPAGVAVEEAAQLAPGGCIPNGARAVGTGCDQAAARGEELEVDHQAMPLERAHGRRPQAPEGGGPAAPGRRHLRRPHRVEH